MKKSLSLLAIVCLVLSMGLMSQVFANAPVYPEVPSVKLFTDNVGLTPAFDLAWFNTAPDGFNADTAASYAITVNFMGNASLAASAFSGAASNVNAGGYSAATDGSNTFTMTNAGGATPVSNMVKFSTYKLAELPKVGLNVGSSVTIPVSANNSAGAALPESFGNPNAIVISDPSVVSAVFTADTTGVIVTLNVATTAPVYVDVIASPDAAGPIGNDQDKERIEVYTNLLQNGAFNTLSETTAWGTEPAPGRANIATGTWLASQADSAGDTATGVWQWALASVNDGIKATPKGNYIPMAAGKWYISRMRLCDSNPGNADQGFLYSFSVAAAAGILSDISADVDAAGIPTTWSWLEAPFFVHVANNGFPQFQLKAGATFGTVYIDEIQVIQATPRIYDGTRGNIRAFFPGGLFASSINSTYWGTQIYYGSAQQPVVSQTDDTLIGSAMSANYAGAASGFGNFYGFKWTAATSGVIFTPAVTVGRQAGATMQLDIVSGLTGATELNQALIAAYGTSANGNSAINHLDAAAMVGLIPAGMSTLQTAGVQTNPYMQLQFGFRADATGVVNFSNVDVVTDTNDPNFGDATLFP